MIDTRRWWRAFRDACCHRCERVYIMVWRDGETDEWPTEINWRAGAEGGERIVMEFAFIEGRFSPGYVMVHMQADSSASMLLRGSQGIHASRSAVTYNVCLFTLVNCAEESLAFCAFFLPS